MSSPEDALDEEPVRTELSYLALQYITRYGWLLVFAAFLLHWAFKKYIAPQFDAIRAADELAARKKYDDDVSTRVSEKMRLAREKQQQHHDIVSIHLEEERKRKEEEKLEKLRQELAQRSVVEAALGSHDVQKLTEKKKAAKEQPKETSPLDNLIGLAESAPVVIFSKSFCPFCRKAKAVLSTFRLSKEDLVYVELDEFQDNTGESLQQELSRVYDRPKMPAVFIAGQFIGGEEEVVGLQRDGILDVLVKDALSNWEKRKTEKIGTAAATK